MPRQDYGDKRLPESKQIFRYWVEVVELEGGSARTLPLRAIAKIHMPRKKGEPQRPREEILQLTDGAETLEAKSVDDFAGQLRQRYPDVTYKCTLHREHDRPAEERRTDALNLLGQLVVESFVEGLSKDDAAALSVWFKTREGKNAFRESWPKIVDAYFHALCNPKR
jgi:hypothetical protein